MSNLTVAVLAPPDYAKDLGKKGTTSDITFYNLKKGEATVTFIEPTRYPEKLSSLFYAVSLADRVILVVDEINATFGECVLMLQCANKSRGDLIFKNYISPDQVAPLIKGTVLEHYNVLEEDMVGLREKMLEITIKQAAHQKTHETGKGVVTVDAHFNVKGVGVVVLGSVVQGMIRKHETLKLIPTEKTAQIRSIQKHDDDSETAVIGDRVGLALKNIESEDLDRGFVLTNDPAIRAATTISGKAQLVKYWPAPLKEGMVLYAGHWMQFLPTRLEKIVVEGGDWRMPTLTLSLEKALVYPPNARIVLHYLEGGKLRVVGSLMIQ
ncbi:MAG TPA: EF-Tu/IF-2/RF-3 family GTPase [Methanoregula sp.]|nr:EF-Tu/IF-2/RF-3 family GTPase [Methanoregula sp.]